METIKITAEQAHEMRKSFLKSADKKRLGITGYQMVTDYGWYFKLETDAAVLLTGFNEVGTYSDYEQEDVDLWLPKSQIKVFEYVDTDEDDYEAEKTYYLIFVKTWLFNQEKSKIQLNHFKSYAY
jgi:hypothetical protein